MSQSVFGYPSQAEFEAAVNRELGVVNSHSQAGAGPGRDRPKAEQQTQGVRLRGKPGSPERLAQVAHLAGAGNRQLIHEVARSLKGDEILAAVKEVQQRPSQDAISRAARLVAEYEDVHVARAAINALRPTGYLDNFVAELRDQADAVEDEKARNDEQAERKRLEDRQKVIHGEYLRVGHDPEAVAAVDQLAYGLGDLLYDEQMEDDEARVMLRTQAEIAQRQQHALDGFALHSQMDEELRRYGPAGNDEDRERYERDLKNASLEVYDRANPTPEQAAEAAMHSVAYDKAFAEKSPLEVALDREFAEMAQHDSRAEHKQVLRDQAVSEWENQYDESGRLKVR